MKNTPYNALKEELHLVPCINQLSALHSDIPEGRWGQTGDLQMESEWEEDSEIWEEGKDGLGKAGRQTTHN